MKSKKFVIVALFLLALSLTACATPNPLKGVALEETGEVYGFLNGVWDGMTAMWAIILNLLGFGNYGIYQVHNNGVLYDISFVLGISAVAGTAASTTITRRQS